MAKTVLVIGATGDVGKGIVNAALEQEWSVVACARDLSKLERWADTRGVSILAGDLLAPGGADAVREALPAIDAVVVAINAPNRVQPLAEWRSDDLSEVFTANVLSHLKAVQTFLPALRDDGVFVGIGGGTADFIIPGMSQLSMSQAALRMMYKGLAKESVHPAALRELIIVSMVNGESKREKAKPEWVTDIEVGRHVCAIIKDPDAFPGPILRLENREQVSRKDTI